jgi:hypothetical protein
MTNSYEFEPLPAYLCFCKQNIKKDFPLFTNRVYGFILYHTNETIA